MEWYGINSHVCLCLVLLLFSSITIIIDLSFWLFCSQLTLFIAKWHSIIWIYNDWLMLMDIWAISSLGPLWVKLLWTCLLVPSVWFRYTVSKKGERQAPVRARLQLHVRTPHGFLTRPYRSVLRQHAVSGPAALFCTDIWHCHVFQLYCCIFLLICNI